jgi:spermidine synthase
VQQSRAWASPAGILGRMLPAFTGAIFFGACLLFSIQPMFTKMSLPLLGGSPAVWATSLVFYQLVLLLGYLYAHVSRTRLSLRAALLVHALVLCIAWLTLPVAPPPLSSPPANIPIELWLFHILAKSVGLPFFALAATSPLLQSWFARTTHGEGRNPYQLYVASNAGSLAALLAYPFLIEPFLGLGAQRMLWTGGYALFALLAIVCGSLAVATEDSASAAAPAAAPATSRERLRWLALAAIPSALMLGVTTHLSTAVAPIPLLWTIPLAVYLLTFTLAFARKPPISIEQAVRFGLVPVIGVLYSAVAGAQCWLPLYIAIHVAGFFFLALIAHSRLAASRPPAEKLTEFYLVLSAGGALGGIFGALVAPALFRDVTEYPLAIALGCFAIPEPAGAKQRSNLTFRAYVPAGFACLLALSFWYTRSLDPALGATINRIAFGIVFLAALRLFDFSRNAFAIAMSAVVLVSALLYQPLGNVLDRERNIFGVKSVVADPVNDTHNLVHSGTLHGVQRWNGDSREPLSYYRLAGPVGQIFDELHRTGRSRSVGVIGMGAGIIAAYRRPAEDWTFYEIDPQVVDIARNRALFTFLTDGAAPPRVVVGDARIELTRDSSVFDLLILDAYSSDQIPLHLLTREALALYLKHLAPGGAFAFNISNRHFDLRPVLANIAADAGLTLFVRTDQDVSAQQAAQGYQRSTWGIAVRAPADAGAIARDPRWSKLGATAQLPLWTDDYTSLIRVLRWI